ncbi:MAG: hypothetical protein ACT4NL_09905, partial [Pseudomarimonas sp.]
MKVQFNLGGAMFAAAMLPVLAASAGVASAQANLAVDSVYTDSSSRVKPAPQTTQAAALWRAPLAVLHDNGSLVTGVGNGLGGADTSAIVEPRTIFGFGAQSVVPNRVSDDFTVTGGAWQIDTITTFAYQTGSSTTSTLTGQVLQIWDGRPDLVTSSVVWGDLSTNVLGSSTWSGIYRVTNTTLTNAQRPIMANVINVGIVLPAGTYWLEWSNSGTLGSGPWAPPLPNPAVGNAGQSLTGVWTFPVLDVGLPNEFPFVVEGTAIGGFSCSDLTQVVGVWGLNAGRCGNFTSTATVATYESAIYDFEPAMLRGTAPGEYSYEVEFISNRPRQPSATTSLLVNGSPLPLQTATQNWNRAIAFNISGNGKYSIFRYNGSGLPVAVQKWVTPVGAVINAGQTPNILRVDRVLSVPIRASAQPNAVTTYNLVFSINGVVVRILPEPFGADQFGIGFTRGLPATGVAGDD